MALFPLNPGLMPLGLLDMLDTSVSALLGGEVLTLGESARTNTSTEAAARDSLDGYLYDTTPTRINAKLATAASEFPLFLCDDGTASTTIGNGYFTMFGTLLGPRGVGAATAVGPNTMAGSGKVTCWDKPGLYAVSTDAVGTDFVSRCAALGSGPGQPIGFNASSKFAVTGGSGAVAGSGVAYLVEFVGSPSFVTTPTRLVSATNPGVSRVIVSYHCGYSVRTL